jgi:hypothetical protein
MFVASEINIDDLNILFLHNQASEILFTLSDL